MRSRRRSTPWIHRWSRLLIGAIAVLGALLTAYLTVVKLTGNTAACPTNGCEQVLSSPYATIFGLPLALFGCLAYTSMAVFALAPLAVNQEDNKDLHSNLENWTWLLLLAGATAMTVFSGYLMYLLAFKIKTVCLYCLVSAAFSLSLLVLTFIGRVWEDIGQLLFTGIVVGMVALISTMAVYANIPGTNPTTGPTTQQAGKPVIPEPKESPKPGIGWQVTLTSGPAEIDLGRHLKKVGAKMYGAYWCNHCYAQKELFGKEAFSEISYIECAPDGKNSQTNLCVKADIRGYPTWEVNGKKLESGVKTLEELADSSGYKGSRDFKYALPRR
ncbi:MAG TPA: vitamin K epoxide reductase family protein [Candidatus Obscuribacterales bacterium]